MMSESELALSALNKMTHLDFDDLRNQVKNQSSINCPEPDCAQCKMERTTLLEGLALLEDAIEFIKPRWNEHVKRVATLQAANEKMVTELDKQNANKERN